MVLIMGAIALVVFQMDSRRVEALDDGKGIQEISFQINPWAVEASASVRRWRASPSFRRTLGRLKQTLVGVEQSVLNCFRRTMGG